MYRNKIIKELKANKKIENHESMQLPRNMYHFKFQWISIYQLYFFHFFSFPRSSIDTNFFQCLPIFFLIDFRDEIYIGNLQALPTLVPYTNPYRSTHPPTFQLTVVLIKKKNAPLSHRGSKLFTWLSGERSHCPLFPTSPPPPPQTRPPRLVFYYLYINHLRDNGQYFQLEGT